MVKTMKAVRQVMKASGETSSKVAKMRKSMLQRRMQPRRILGADAASRGPARENVVRVPKGSMMTADFKPDRVREFYDPATGKTLYRRRG